MKKGRGNPQSYPQGCISYELRTLEQHLRDVKVRILKVNMDTHEIETVRVTDIQIGYCKFKLIVQEILIDNFNNLSIVFSYYNEVLS